MKKIQLICMGVILAVSLCACAGNSKPVEQNKSASESSVEEKVETDSGKTDEDPGKNTSDDWKKYSSLEEYAETISADIQASADKINKEWEAVNKDTDSYEAYRDNKDRVTGFYAFGEGESATLYAGLSDKAVNYFKAIVESGAVDDYDKWDGAMEKFYDTWDNSVSGYYDTWDGIYGNSYDHMDNTVTMDATSDYEEYSNLWAEMYKAYSDSWGVMYKQYSDSWAEIYAMYSDVWAGFYAGEKDVDKIISEGKIKREEAAEAATGEQSAHESKEPEKSKIAEEETEPDKNEEAGESGSVFDPQDVSDETIESIETYGDYLIMYEKIVEDYLANYEDVVKDTALYDEAAFQQMKDEVDEEIESQEEEYGAMKDQKIVGKDSVVEFLKSYRDSLQEMVDSYEETVKALN